MVHQGLGRETVPDPELESHPGMEALLLRQIWRHRRRVDG